MSFDFLYLYSWLTFGTTVFLETIAYTGSSGFYGILESTRFSGTTGTSASIGVTSIIGLLEG